MAIEPFLAMTAAEMYRAASQPEKIAWMACHFSPYGTGLSNLPKKLPPDSLLTVDDVTPPHGHDPVLIAEQLSVCVDKLQCCGILLDFQREKIAETSAIAVHLADALPCPVVISEAYAAGLDRPVFLPPVPPSIPLDDYLSPWKGQDIWLEVGLSGEMLTLTEQGCEVVPLPYPATDAEGFSERTLHCHYAIETTEQAARFTLWRTMEDWQDLLAEAETLGIAGVVGLYQELHRFAEDKKALPSGEGASAGGG